MWRPASHNPLGGEAQPDMVRGPHAIGIAKRRPQQLDDLGKDLLPPRLLELLEEGAAEGFEPALHADVERRRPRHEHDRLYGKTALLEQAAIFGNRRKEPGSDFVWIAAMERADGPHRRGDGRHIAVTAKLADEAAARVKSAM